MPNTLGKNLHLCFTKIKRPLEPESPVTLLSPKDHSRTILMKNYNSLYDSTFDSKPQSPSSASSSSSSADEPDFATIFASQRFFFSSPGRSNSIIESTPSFATSIASSDTNDPMSRTHNNNMNDHQLVIHSSSTNDDHHQSIQSWKSSTVKDSVAVPTYSPDPYVDFRRSMQEMVEARDLVVDVKADWDFLHELLLCYLALNPKSTHKFIVGAFADLLVSLSSSQTTENADDKETEFAAGC